MVTWEELSYFDDELFQGLVPTGVATYFGGRVQLDALRVVICVPKSCSRVAEIAERGVLDFSSHCPPSGVLFSRSFFCASPENPCGFGTLRLSSLTKMASGGRAKVWKVVRVLCGRKFGLDGWEVQRCPPRQLDQGNFLHRRKGHARTVTARLRTTHTRVSHLPHKARICARGARSTQCKHSTRVFFAQCTKQFVTQQRLQSPPVTLMPPLLSWSQAIVVVMGFVVRREKMVRRSSTSGIMYSSAPWAWTHAEHNEEGSSLDVSGCELSLHVTHNYKHDATIRISAEEYKGTLCDTCRDKLAQSFVALLFQLRYPKFTSDPDAIPQQGDREALRFE